MNSKFLTALATGMLLTASFCAFGSPDEAQKFFNFASQGKYVDMLNLQNNDGMTALFYAVKNDLLRTSVGLHGIGALSIVGGKKASDYAASKKVTVVLEGWQKYEVENVNKDIKDKFADFGADLKD